VTTKATWVVTSPMITASKTAGTSHTIRQSGGVSGTPRRSLFSLRRDVVAALQNRGPLRLPSSPRHSSLDAQGVKRTAAFRRAMGQPEMAYARL
jgi:hypothetical protein